MLPNHANTPENFLFHGTGREYFKTWIVNLALTIATQGIYAAWAKVRTRKHFYQVTELKKLIANKPELEHVWLMFRRSKVGSPGKRLIWTATPGPGQELN